MSAKRRDEVGSLPSFLPFLFFVRLFCRTELISLLLGVLDRLGSTHEPLKRIWASADVEGRFTQPSFLIRPPSFRVSPPPPSPSNVVFLSISPRLHHPLWRSLHHVESKEFILTFLPLSSLFRSLSLADARWLDFGLSSVSRLLSFTPRALSFVSVPSTEYESRGRSAEMEGDSRTTTEGRSRELRLFRARQLAPSALPFSASRLLPLSSIFSFYSAPVRHGEWRTPSAAGHT